MRLILEGRAMSWVTGSVGIVEDVVPEYQGRTIVGIRVLVNSPVGGLVLPRFLAKRRGLLRWYPLGGGYFPAEGLKPSVEEILYAFEHDPDMTDILFYGDAYGKLSVEAATRLEFRVRELELMCQGLMDNMWFIRENLLKVISDIRKVEDEQFLPAVKRLEEIQKVAGSGGLGGLGGTKTLRKKLEELEKKLGEKDKKKEEEQQEGEEEYQMGIIDSAIANLQRGGR